MQQPFVVTPPVYRHDGITPFAAPTTLNADISVRAVTGGYSPARGVLQGRLIAPYQVQRPVLMLPPAPPRRRPVFRSRMFCVTCGWRRNVHLADEGVADKCTRAFCGRCYNMKMYHAPGKFGKNCDNAVNYICAPFLAQWYSAVSVSFLLRRITVTSTTKNCFLSILHNKD